MKWIKHNIIDLPWHLIFNGQTLRVFLFIAFVGLCLMLIRRAILHQLRKDYRYIAKKDEDK